MNRNELARKRKKRRMLAASEKARKVAARRAARQDALLKFHMKTHGRNRGTGGLTGPRFRNPERMHMTPNPNKICRDLHALEN